MSDLPALKDDTLAQLRGLGLKPRHYAVLLEYTINGGNLTQAGVALGFTPSSARSLPSRVKGFREGLEIVRERMRVAAENPVSEWTHAYELARTKLEDLLEAQRTLVVGPGATIDAPDNAVQLAAAKTIIEQHSGKPTQKISVDQRVEHTVRIDPDILQIALGYAAARGVALKEAYEFTLRRPKEVRAWLQGPTGEVEEVTAELHEAAETTTPPQETE